MTKTFKDFGLTFAPDENCITCVRGTCHNNVTKYSDGQEYNVFISTYDNSNYYEITMTKLGDSSDEKIAFFHTEKEAVDYVCQNFDWFKCF
jgi:hypothetical protein